VSRRERVPGEGESQCEIDRTNGHALGDAEKHGSMVGCCMSVIHALVDT